MATTKNVAKPDFTSDFTVSVNMDSQKMKSATINGQKLKKCYPDVHRIEDATIARQMFRYVELTDPERFVGYTAGFCSNVDEGWVFIMDEDDGYLAYTGPYEFIVFVTRMDCR